ncbi:M56 family metallopeptidase [Thalassotalea castellviae]|uniref:M56 family metallopeptidase n=1 Tax=Thalassotalea castellviae TaxID=3075612 RepID=A0ABU3A0S1_9GAMM|nr:M56 family metallopeptidase [Thalassotalea sp. W431]MDT0603774.1 M56 family metallopeptidase [Thalassotalea sp. W431]
MESVISSPLLYNLALTLIHFLWQGCLIALALKFLLIITPHQQSKTRYTFSAIAMIACLIVPIITYIAIYQPSYAQLIVQPDQNAFMLETAILTNDEAINWYQEVFEALPYVSMVWISIVTFLATKLIIELYNVNQLPKQGTMRAEAALQRRFEALVKKVNLRKSPQLLISLKTDIPMAIGWLKPVILIPAAMLTGLTPTQLDMLILHELAHIRRHDYLVNFFQTIIETLLFFHPAIAWISKQMRNEREYCSDDIAVNLAGNPIAYAHTLADTANLCRNHRHHAIPTMAMAASGGDLKQRVVRLVNQHHCSSNDDSGKFLASVLIIFSVLIVAIKPYLNNTIIDFTSGRISFFKTASDIIKQQPTNAANLSATSVAQMLLQQEQKNALALENESSISAPKVNSRVTKITVPTMKFTNITAKKSPSLNKAADERELANDHTVQENSYLANNKTKNDITTATSNAAMSQQNNSESQTEALLANHQEKSMSELAFERTDSNNTQSKMKNPYSNQVAALNDEPRLEHTQTTTSQARPNQEQPRPLYTITTVEKTKTATSRPKRKSAEILRSPDPKYPSTATRRGIEMDVTVSFVIDTDGIVQDITFEQKNRVSYFRSAIRNAMAKWRFLPAQVNGRPVESKMTKIFSFSLAK